MAGGSFDSSEQLHRELVRLLRVAFPTLEDLRAFAAEHAPELLAAWQISLGAAAPAPALPLVSRVRNRLRLYSAPPPSLGRPSAEAPARELARLLIDEAHARGSEHALLDAVGRARTYLIDEVIAVRALLRGERGHPPFPRSPLTSRSLQRQPGPIGFGGEAHTPTTSGRDTGDFAVPPLPAGYGPGDEPLTQPPPFRSTGAFSIPSFPAGYIEKGLDLPLETAGGDSDESPGPGLSGDPLAAATPQAQPASAAEAPRLPPQIVSLGFANLHDPSAFLVDRTLATDDDYLLWLEIQPDLVPGSAGGAVPMSGLREGDLIEVILFGFPDQLQLGEHRHGRIRLAAAGNRVEQPAWPRTPRELASLTLYFAVRTPDKPGSYSLRANLYSRGLLLQSHLVTAQVTAPAREHRQAVRRIVDYNLTASLDTARLGQHSACDVSLFLNDDGKGTHSLRFVSSSDGVPEQIADGHIEAGRLAKAMDYSRQALRFAAWGKLDPYTREDRYALASAAPEHLAKAWRLLARRGANLWLEIAEMFGYLGAQALALREKMRAPGRLQLALKASADAVLPAALIYDYPLDVGLQDLSICKTATAAIAAGRDLAAEPCFQGQCPHYQEPDIVCPGGFWGFRHELGLPIHLPKGEVVAEIPRQGLVRAFAGLSLDPAFVKRDAHIAELAALFDGGCEVLRDRKSCLARLKEERHVVYFYCHGGLAAETDTPFLEVGPPGSDPLFAQSLLNAGVSWEKLRPLVMLNGCHTTAASPEAMFSMLSAFASHCNAAGVIGTEVTTFEPVAVPFGLELLKRFLGGEPLGAAVRQARLALLRTGNPLGLMYIPYALPSLRLV